MKIGMPVTILGILAIIVGGAMYADNYHKTIGLGGIVLGVVLIIIGVILWMMKEKTPTPTPAASQPAQPTKT
jgi:Na+/phosphate symporter